MNESQVVHGPDAFDALAGRLAASPAVQRWGATAYDHYVGQLSQTSMAHMDTLADAAGITEESQVLELGCGAGGFACHVASRTGCNVVALDWSQTALALAQGRADALGVVERVRFAQCDIRQLELPTGPFDVAVAIDALQFVPEFGALTSAVADALTAGGRLAVIATVNRREESVADGAPLTSRAALTAAYAAAGFLPPETTSLTASYAKLVDRMARSWRADLDVLGEQLGSALARSRLDEDLAILRLLQEARVDRVFDIARHP